jgi:lysophospholipase L1-like esterase
MNHKVMIKIVMIAMACLLVSPQVKAQRYDFANFGRYAEANKQLGQPAKNNKRVVFMGNSITDNWAAWRPDFFKSHGYIGRGISGQTSFQFLLRFRQDVIDLHPKVVVINYGTNDIAENTGAYNEDLTFENVQSMVDMARANKIKVILASTLPAEKFLWRPSITDAMAKIRHLNARVKAYAEANKIPFVDYFSAMVSEDGKALNPKYAPKGETVHPDNAGYEVMEALIVKAINKIL